MPIVVDGKYYYTTSEACKEAGISKATYLRWIKEGIIKDVSQADRRGWRLFTREDIDRMHSEKNKIGHFERVPSSR